MPPNYMCGKGKAGAQFFNKTFLEDGKVQFSLKPMDQYMAVRKL
jgi:hypothetical protein